MSRAVVVTLGLLLAAGTAPAQEPAPAAEETAAPDPWAVSLGVSYVATSGNSSSSTGGIDFDAVREEELWTWTNKASAVRVEQDGDIEAERFVALTRLARQVDERWSVRGGLRAERDEIAGIDLRSIAELSGEHLTIERDRLLVVTSGGVTYTRDDLAGPPYGTGGTDGYWGAILSNDGEWTISEGSALTWLVGFLPSFDEADDYRIEGATQLTSAVNDHLALKIGWEARYDNEPVPGRTTTDTTTKASLVVSW